MIDYAKRYEDKVLNGDLVACNEVKRACEIDRLNRKKSHQDSYPYYYDQKIANEYVTLAKILFPKKPALFQLAFISLVHGWRLKSNPKIRRYQEALYTMARKNAKSTEASVIMVSMLLHDELNGLMNRQYYFVATKLSQAMLSLRQAKDMILKLQKSSELARKFKITKTKIYSTETGSKIEALPSRPQSLDGLNPVAVDIDEVHELNDDKLIQVLKSAMALQPNALLLFTSTCGFNYKSPLRIEWKTAENALNNKVMDSRLLPFIYTMDNKKEIFKNPNSWVKANPLMDVPSVKAVMLPFLKNQLHQATIQKTTNSTIVKNFNRWGSTNDNNFVSLDKWKSNEVKPVSLSNKQNVVLGLDLSKSHDLSSLSWSFKLPNGKYYTDVHAWVAVDGDKGIETKSKADRVDYLKLEHEGKVTICNHSYGLIDYKSIERYILKLVKKYDITPFLAYDPWGSSTIIQDLASNPNISLVKVQQNVKNLTGTIREMYRLIVSHKLVHPANVLYDYSFHNLTTSYDSHGNVYLNKARNADKIDPCFSLLDSINVQQNLELQNKNSILKQELDNNEFSF